MTSYQEYNIFLIKSGINSSGRIVQPDKYTDKFSVAAGEILGELYIARPKYHSVPWIEFFRQYNSQIPSFTTGSPSGLFLFNYNDNYFALTYGVSSRHWFHDETIEKRFGLLTALSLIGEDRLKALETNSLSKLALKTHQQLPKQGATKDFRLEFETDLLKFAQGVMNTDDSVIQLSGRDSLKIRLKIGLENLSEKLEKIIAAYKDPLPEHFLWVERLVPVEEPGVISELYNYLIENLQSRNLEFVLALPDILPNDSTSGFCYKLGARISQTFSDLDLADYFSFLSKKQFQNISVERLRASYVRTWSPAASKMITVSNVYNCLHGETYIEGKCYVLNSGSWYLVDQDLYDNVMNRFKMIPKYELEFPRVILPKTNPDRRNLENEMNQQLTEHFGGNKKIICLDNVDINIKSFDKYEHCDMLTADKKMIHVKRTNESKSASHLFNQGLVSGQSFKLSRVARHKLMEKLIDLEVHDDFLIDNPDEDIDASKYKIIFAIAQEGDEDIHLPFFAKLILCQVYQKLNDEMGYSVSLSKIEIVRIGDVTKIDSDSSHVYKI